MKFSEFRRLQPKATQNVFVFICEDDFLVEESRAVWTRIFGGDWQFDKMTAKEFEEIPSSQLMDDARTASLFATNRAIIVSNADKIKKERFEDLTAIRDISNASLKVILVTGNRKPAAGLAAFQAVEIDPLKPADVARWLMDRYKLTPDLARYLVDNIGADLYHLHTEIEKLQTYTGGSRPIEARDVDTLILRSESYGPFELDDAVLAKDYKKAVQVLGAMLDEGQEPLLILSRIARVWRQLFIGKSLARTHSARDVAMAANAPSWKAAEFAAACKRFEWNQLAAGFRELLNADRAFKTSSPNAEGYFDVMLWKMIG